MVTRPLPIVLADDSVEDRIVIKDISSGTLRTLNDADNLEGALARFTSSPDGVALIGGRIQRGGADRSRESGCDAQVSKPVRPAALRQATGWLAAGVRAVGWPSP